MEFHPASFRAAGQRSAIAVLALCTLGATTMGCSTEFQYGGTNGTDRAIIYVAKVNDKSVATTQVAAGSNLAPTSLGKYKRGSKIGVDVTLPEGGRISENFQTLLDKPDPTIISPNTANIPGIHVDFGNASDLENSINDISGSYRSPTPIVTNLLDSVLGGVFLVTDNPADAANPWVTLIYNPTQLSSAVPANFYSPGQFPAKFTVTLVLDKEASGQVAADVPSITSVKADFSQSSVYKYSMELNDTGWRVSPISWNQIAAGLNGSDGGRRILADIASRISHLQRGQHLFYLNQAYIIGNLNVSTYQAQALNANTNIQADTYVTAMGAFKVSDNVYDQKTAQNIVLRVRYDDLSVVVPPPPPPVAPSALALRSRSDSVVGAREASPSVVASAAVRKKVRYPF